METEPPPHVPMSSSLQELTLHPATSREQSITTSELVAILCSSDLANHAIVIDGPMGSGKTLLLKSIKEKSPHSICTCIQVDLANPELHSNETALKECIEQQKKGFTHSKHLLYLFDAFDEFVLKCKWDLDKFFSIVEGEVQNGAVVVATRPCGALNQLFHECKVERHYSIVGFSPECVHGYFEAATSPRDFKRIGNLLKQHKHVLTKMCKNPLICTQVVDTIRRKKIRTLTLTDVVHDVVLGVVKTEILKTRGEHIKATNLHSLEAEHFEIICVLAFLDLVHASKLESLESFSFFLSSFFLKYGISSLKEVEDLGLLYHCDQASYYAKLKKKLYWFLCPEVRDFLASFMLHLWPPLDQLYFLSEHAQKLIKSGKDGRDGYSGWLQFFYGLTVQREAEYNPTRMMMSSLNELLAHCLSLDNSLQLMIFILCLAETHEPSLWRKLATRNINFFDMSLTANEVEMIEPCLVDLIGSSGFKEWIIEISPDKRKVVDALVEKVSRRAKVQILEDDSLDDKVKLWPKITASSSARNQSKKNVDVGVFHCRAIRELLQRVLQLYTPWKLKGDCSSPSYVSFLNCDCFRKAVEDRIFFEPVVATHFLLLEEASKKAGKGESDAIMRHIKESHDDKAVELVILLQPCLRRLTFHLPISGGESTDIQLRGDYLPDTDYTTFVAMYAEGLEEVVQCIVAQELTPTKTEIVIPCLPINVEFKAGTVAPRISIPPSERKLSSKTEADITGINPPTHHTGESTNYNYAQQVDSEGGPSLGVVSIPSQVPFGEGRLTTQPIQQQQKMPQQSSRRLTNVKPGTVLFTSEPSQFPLNLVLPLPDESVLIQMGGNGQIFDGKIQGLEVAVKKTPYRSKEYAIITRVQHRNLIQLIAFIWGEENPTHKRRYFCYHVMPKMSGDLARMVTDKPDLTLSALHHTNFNRIHMIAANLCHILSSILEALAYLHSIHVVHRDIKPSNILIKFNCSCTIPLFCSCPTKFKVLLCDFDAAIQLDPDDCMQPVSFPSSQTMLALAPQYHCIPVGTGGYRAPECSLHITANYPDCFSPPITSLCDIFSLGVLCVRLMVGDEGPHRQKALALLLLHYHREEGCVEGKGKVRVPTAMVEETLKIDKVRREMKWLRHSSDFVECCLQVNPHSRHTATQLLLHPFIMNTGIS